MLPIHPGDDGAFRDMFSANTFYELASREVFRPICERQDENLVVWLGRFVNDARLLLVV